jgi:hypothetical protein
MTNTAHCLLPPPLAPPRKGEGDLARHLIYPSPLRGGVRGGGTEAREAIRHAHAEQPS